ncbi:MAG: hypothetical protein M3463_17425 [Verrucomicrobiota bacterium]|nr:hypothetical protein [Verrucomicrobiota bacterium]
MPALTGLKGASLAPLLAEPGRAWDRPALTFVTRTGGVARRVRTERYAYTEWPDGSAMLFDHEKDPHEFDNLASDPAHARAMEELKRLLPPEPAGGKRGKKQ